MTREQARDTVCLLVKSALGDRVPLLFPDISGEPPATGPFARVQIGHTPSRQASLANHEGKRRWEHTGLVTIQVFTPAGDGRTLSDELVAVAIHAFQDASGDVWYRNPGAVEAGQAGAYAQTNVTADFQYDEVR